MGYQGRHCADACERGDLLMSLAEVEVALTRSAPHPCEFDLAIDHEPGVRLCLEKRAWLSAARRRTLQPRCSTFGCSLPDLHAGLHQVTIPLCKRRSVPRRRAGDVKTWANTVNGWSKK